MIASLFFFYEFIQMNMFNAISNNLMRELHIDATGLSRMSAFYFVANVIFLFPAGILLDRFSAKKVILIALGVCVIGTGLFSIAKTEAAATFFRFLTGIGSAFCFLSVIRLATRWFQAKSLALVIGCVVTMAMLGGFVAQKPFSLLVSFAGWRHAVLVDAALGALIFILILAFVYDFPKTFQRQYELELKQVNEIGYWKGLGLAFLKMQNWLGGLFGCLMNLPLIILGGLWGVSYLVAAHGVPQSKAPEITQWLFIGTIIGAPLAGWISDRMGKRREPMIVGAIAALLLIIILMWFSHLSIFSLIVLFFLIGLFTSAQVISYSVVAENSIPAITAMSVSVVNISVQGGLAVFEPAYGYLMDLHHKLISHSTNPIYAAKDFNWAMLLFPVGIILAVVIAMLIKETYCQSRGDALRSRVT